MKRFVLSAALLATAPGCVFNQQDSPVRLTGTFSVRTGTECGINETLQQGGGSLDISAIRRYVMGVGLQSLLVSPSTTTNVGELAGTGNNDAYFEQWSIRYTSEPNVGLPAEEKLNINFVLPAGADTGSFLVTDGLGPKALETLRTAVQPGSQVTVTTTVQGLGRVAGTPFATNQLGYSIIIYSSGFPGCPVGQLLERNGPCGLTGGQDATLPKCITP